jgi:hypothetical protein
MPRASKVPKPVQIVQAACPESNRRVQPPGSSPGSVQNVQSQLRGFSKYFTGAGVCIGFSKQRSGLISPWRHSLVRPVKFRWVRRRGLVRGCSPLPKGGLEKG